MSLRRGLDLQLLLQSLQAELAAAEEERQALLQQAQGAFTPADCQTGSQNASDGNLAADATKDQRLLAGSLPPKVPSSLKNDKPKQPPLRSLSWGGGSKPSVKPTQQPQRRSSFSIADTLASQSQVSQPQQPLQLQNSVQHKSIPHWLSQEQSSAAASEEMNVHAVRQEVLQEVLQAVTVVGNATSNVDFNNLTVKVQVFSDRSSIAFP